MHASVRYIDGNEGRLDPGDRGLAYGDGLFETMAARGGQVRWLDLHLERLSEGCRRLSIPAPDPGELRERILERARTAGHAVIKLILTRGTGPRGYAPPADPEPTVVLFAYPALPEAERGTLRVVTLRMRLGENAKLAGIKHLCRLEQVLARLELASRAADEGLLRGADGRVVGGTSANVFAVTGSCLRTPRITGAGICGIMRRVVLEHSAEHGLRAEEADLTVAELASADEVFMTNALMGIRPVRLLDERRFGDPLVARGLQEALGMQHDA